MRWRNWIPSFALVCACAAIAGCGGTTTLIVRTTSTSQTPASPATGIGFPVLATKNTTRVSGVDPISDAAGVALAVFPSAAPGTHPAVVTIAPTDDWEAAIASSVLMSSPTSAPVLLSGPGTLPVATSNALGLLAPTGSGALAGAQVIQVGDVPAPKGLKTKAITGNGPYALAAAINGYANAAAGKASSDVVIASADDPAYAMPAAGWAAESGDPVLFVSSSGVPAPTAQALVSDGHPHIYVLGPSSVIPDSVLAQLGAYGTVARVGAQDPAANSVAFAIYRDPPCVVDQPCAHVPGSFGWAMRSPGHGYTLLNASLPLDAAASAALSASGSYGPQLVLDSGTALPTSVLNFFLDYATPGYTQEGPTAAVYNHAWLIGDPSTISVAVQAEVDSLLEVVPQK
ncbi:MAG TPA: cell wall-binding repeat-containing protein [Solirubrobacteraceae bacterium]|nr:cell wall-binding repeat-containing protein [Solirubrobacteraceae bacterium]